MTIREATITDIPVIQKIAYKTWPVTYGSILSEEQLTYMLDLFYSKKALVEQFQKKVQLFYIANDEFSNIGFASIQHNYNNEAVTRIHKIYFLPQTQGKGFGKITIQKIAILALQNHSKKLSLNVNRFNLAHFFYKKIGFEVVAEEDIEIGNGYLMEDYKMEKKL